MELGPIRMALLCSIRSSGAVIFMRLLVSCPEVVCAFKSRVFLGLTVAIGKPTPVKLSVVLGQTHATVVLLQTRVFQ